MYQTWQEIFVRSRSIWYNSINKTVSLSSIPLNTENDRTDSNRIKIFDTFQIQKGTILPWPHYIL